MRVGGPVALLFFVVSVTQASDVFVDLWYRARRLPTNYEAAAFLVRDSDCTVRSVAWPPSRRPYRATFDGEIPPGTIAIAHTHPDQAHLRLPSPEDVELARHLGLDVYVVTRGEVWVARTNGRIALVSPRARGLPSGECRQATMAAAAR